ncbi:translocation/assembly module TamB domain-containing protein [Pelagibius marinus]|uniref:translocation/assembly module TamB domain-containing protein n=1 Tax=Pelagibius marinus TaxID=2762760 RepID=UPI0018726CF8|nr:translocation/assembly module TamB domain-containing protein [Pelagibius marinus]
MRRAKSIAKWGLIGLGGLLLLGAAALALGYAWLNSEGGRAWLARQIEDAASTPGEMELSIGRLEGALPAQLQARDVVLRDTEGAWLTIAGLDLAWRPWALLSRTLEVDSLSLSGVELARLPAAPAETPEAEDESGSGLPQLPVKIRIARLAADEIALGAPVLGQAARFTLAGVAGSREDGSLEVGFDLERLDGVEAKLRAELDYDPAGDALTAAIDAAEAPGGLLATLLEIPDLPRAEMKLNGSGPLRDWKGDFALSLGTVAQAGATIGLQRDAGGDLGFSLRGQATIAPPSQSDLWALAAGDTALTLQGVWQDARRLDLAELTIANDRLRLGAQGTVEPESGALDLTLNLAVDQGQALARLIDFDRLDKLSAEVALSGSFDAPQAEIALHGEGLAGPDVAAAGASVTGNITGAAQVLALDLAGRIDGPRLPGEDAVNQVLGAELPFTLRAKLDLDSLVLDIAALEAGIDAAQLSGSGPFNLDAGTADLQATLVVPDLARLQPLTEITLGGQARLAGPLTLQNYGSDLRADLAGRWDTPSSDIGLITAAAGQGLDITARLAVADSEVRIEQATARSPTTDLSLALIVAGDELRDGRYSLTLKDAAVLAAELGADFAGPAQVQGTLSGPFDALALAGEVQAAGLTLAEQKLSDLTGRYDLRLKGAEVDGPVSLALASPYGRAEADAELRVRDDAVTLAALSARLPETRVAGEVVLPLDGGDPQAELNGEIADLGVWLATAGLEGSGKGKVTLQWNRAGAAAPLLATADLAALTLRPEPDAEAVKIDRLRLELQAQGPDLAQPATFAAKAETLTWQRLKLARLDLDGNGTLDALDLRLAAAGAWVEPLELQAAGRVAQAGETLTVTLGEAKGSAFGQPLALRETATLTLAPGVTRLEGLDLASGDTRLTAEGRLDGENVTATALLEALPLATVDAFWESGLEGSVSATLDLQGPTGAPRGSAGLTVAGLRPRGDKDLPALELTSTAEWRDGQVMLDGRLGGAQVTAASFNATAPLRFTAGGGLEMPESGALTGALDWRGGLNTLLLFAPLPQHRLSGDAEIAVTLRGTVGAPQFDGSLALAQGRYESLEHGTVLRDLALRAELAGDRVTLASLTANDGAGGKLSGKGELDIDPTRDFPFDVEIQFDKFRALRRDDVTAVAGGTVELSGDAQTPRIKGRFTTETVEISLAAQLPPNVVKLDVIEVKDGVVQEPVAEEQAAPPVNAELDIIVDMPGRVFVRGRGLDSDWAGRIVVTGTTAEPSISGEVNLVRGVMSVVGKTFVLQDGKVTLPQDGGGEATIDVSALHEGKELEVTAHMIGPLSEPSLELTSVPEVPQDEIISRVLFNKSASQLSGAEAAQLALALRDLTGRGGGTDVMGFARRTLGVDVLRVDTTAEGKAAVEAGKYVTEDVYVGVKQGAKPEDSGVGVEVELTPNITVETETTGEGDNKSGVRFQLDY